MRFICCHCLIFSFSIISNSANPIRGEIYPRSAFCIEFKKCRGFHLAKRDVYRSFMSFQNAIWLLWIGTQSLSCMCLWIGCLIYRWHACHLFFSYWGIITFHSFFQMASHNYADLFVNPQSGPHVPHKCGRKDQLIAKLRAFWLSLALAVHATI